MVQDALHLYWDDLRVFLAVSKNGSYARAALELGIAQPTVSRRIEALESAIGAQLFNRTPRGPVLTRDGEFVVKEAQAMHLSVARLLERVRGSVKGIAGECKILVPEGLNNFWLTRFLPAFLRRYEHIDLRLFSTFDQSVGVRPPFDIQIQLAPATDGDSVPVRLCTMHLGLFASESYIAQFGRPRSVSDLARFRMLDHTQLLTSQGRWTSFSHSDKPIRTLLFTNSSVVLVEAIRRGVGMGLLPTYAGAVEPTFKLVLPDFKLATGVYANFQRDTGQQPAVRAMIDFLKHVVFEPREQPWFHETFAAPDQNWAELVAEAEARAMRWAGAS
jgi:DNA-binding transcriptional LysR family regulator